MNSEAKRIKNGSGFRLHGYNAEPMAPEAAQEIMGENFFGPEQWLRYYGIWFEKNQLKRIADFPWDKGLLESPCPFNKGLRIKDTHFAFLGLDRLCNRPLDILRWHELNPLPADGKARISAFDSEQDFARIRTCWFKWHLVLIEGIPNSSGKAHKDQISMLPDGYRASFAIEELTKNMLYYKKFGICLSPKKWNRCQDAPTKDSHACVGEFNRVKSCPDSKQHPILGFSAYRKLPSGN